MLEYCTDDKQWGFAYWLHSFTQQAIAWNIVNQVLWCPMA